MQTEPVSRERVDQATDSPPAPQPEDRSSVRRMYAVIAPLLVLLILWIWLFYSEGAFRGGPGGKALGGDYAMFISAAQLIQSHGDPYDPTVLIRIETRLLHRVHVPPIDSKQRTHVRVGNPPVMYWAMEPLIGRPFTLTAWISLLGLYALSALGFIAVLRYFGWTRWFLPTVVFLLMPQVVLGAFYGNPIGIVFASIAMGLLSSRRHPVLAGAIMSLAWLKPPIALPIVLIVALFYVRKPLTFALGFGSASLSLLLLATITSGTSSIEQWVHGLARYSNDMAIQPDIISLNGFYAAWMPSGPRLILEFVSLVAAVWFTAWIWNRERGRDTDFLASSPLWLIWMLASPYGHFYDEIILAIPLVVYFGRNGSMLTHRGPAISLYLVFASLFFISWAPGGVYLLPIPLLLIVALMFRRARIARMGVA